MFLMKLDGSSTPDEIEKFFKELGSGSAKQVPAAVDDDQEFEKKEVVSTIINFINTNTQIAKYLIWKFKRK